MKALAVCRKALRQQARDRLGLALTVLTAPLFVVLYWGLFSDGAPRATACIDGGPEVVMELTTLLREQNAPVEVAACGDVPHDLVVSAPDLAGAAQSEAPVDVRFEGDASSPTFGAAAQQMRVALERYVATKRGQPTLVAITVEASGESGERTPFDLYVPNLLVFAVIMLVFSSAMSIAREVERGTLERLRLTRMRTRDYLAGMAAAQAVLGATAIGATFGVALLLGFETSPGSVPLAAAVAVLTGVACVGVGTLVASLSRSVAQAFAVASFFMFLLLLFSGIVFPIPDFAVLELLPTVHGVRAMHEVLVLGADLSDVASHGAALVGLAALFFGLGGWRFRRLHHTFLHEVGR